MYSTYRRGIGLKTCYFLCIILDYENNDQFKNS